MSRSVGNCCFSQPEICSGDHCSASFCATRHRNSPWSARRQGLGRSARSQALLSASVRTVESANAAVASNLPAYRRWRSFEALGRSDGPTGRPQCHGKSLRAPQASSAATALQRGAGAIPPLRATIRWTPVLFLLLQRPGDGQQHFVRSSSAPKSSSFCVRRESISVTSTHLHTSLSSKIRRRCVDQLRLTP